MKHSSGGEVTLRAAAAGRAVETATAKEVGVFAWKSTVQYSYSTAPGPNQTPEKQEEKQEKTDSFCLG